jgi:hypothetical protein
LSAATAITAKANTKAEINVAEIINERIRIGFLSI